MTQIENLLFTLIKMINQMENGYCYTNELNFQNKGIIYYREYDFFILKLIQKSKVIKKQKTINFYFSFYKNKLFQTDVDAINFIYGDKTDFEKEELNQEFYEKIKRRFGIKRIINFLNEIMLELI